MKAMHTEKRPLQVYGLLLLLAVIMVLFSLGVSSHKRAPLLEHNRIGAPALAP